MTAILTFLLLLPVNLILLALWVLWVPLALLGSPLGLLLAILAAGFGVVALEGEPFGFVPAIILFVFNRILAKKPWPRPPAIVWWRSRPRKFKPVPVPVVQTLTKNHSAPTVLEAYARLSPTLRRVIAEPPPEENTG